MRQFLDACVLNFAVALSPRQCTQGHKLGRFGRAVPWWSLGCTSRSSCRFQCTSTGSRCEGLAWPLAPRRAPLRHRPLSVLYLDWLFTPGLLQLSCIGHHRRPTYLYKTLQHARLLMYKC